VIGLRHVKHPSGSRYHMDNPWLKRRRGDRRTKIYRGDTFSR